MLTQKKYFVESLVFLALKQSFMWVCNAKLRLPSTPNFYSYEKAIRLLSDFEVYLIRINFRLLNCEKYLVLHTPLAVLFFNLEYINCPKFKNCFSNYFKYCFPINKVEIINNSNRIPYMYYLISTLKYIENPMFCFHHSKHVLNKLRRRY